MSTAGFRVLAGFGLGLVLAPVAAFGEGVWLTREEARRRAAELLEVRWAKQDAAIDAKRLAVDVLDSTKLSSAHPFHGLVRDHLHLLVFLLSEAKPDATSVPPDLAASTDLEALALWAAGRPEFEERLLVVLNGWLRQRGGGIRDFEAPQKKRVGLNEALNTTLRFVYPDGFTTEGELTTHFCSSFNAFGDFGHEPEFWLRALSYSAIVGELYADNSPFRKRFDDAVELAKGLELSTDPKVAVTRTQGVVWAVLKQSSELRDTLRRELERLGSLIPLEVDFFEPRVQPPS